MARTSPRAKPKEKPEAAKKAGTPAPVKAVPVSTARPALWDRWFDDFWRHPFPSLAWRQEHWPFAELRSDLGAIDVRDADGEIVVKADLPGVKKDEVQIELTDSTLVIKGERKKEEEIKEEDYVRRERSYGSFSRVIGLSSEVNSDAVKASFKDGVLEVHLPKTEAAKRKPRKVAIE
jgi:HSP20 family protein